MRASPAPVRLGCAHLGDVRHVCAFFQGDDEEYRVLTPFICDGLERGEKAVHIIADNQRRHHVQRLEAAGLNTNALLEAAQLDLRSSAETYLHDGSFDQDRMLAAFEAMASDSAAGRPPRSRIVCNMSWATNNPATLNDLIEFESRVNDIWQRHDDIVVCVYDQRMLGGEMVIDIMRTHPMVLIGEVLQTNPFFTPPAQFLRERRARR